MRLLTLFSLILAAATAIAAMSGTGLCIVVRDDAEAQTFTAMSSTTTNRFKHTPEQRIAAYTNLVTASSMYAKSAAGNAAYAASNNLDYASVKSNVDAEASVEVFLIKPKGRISPAQTYALHGITPAKVEEVKTDVNRIKAAQ